MEYLNQVTLVGTCGSVRRVETAFGTATRFCVATHLAYRSKDGCAVIETTWSSVETDKELDIEKGDAVKVVGHLHTSRYTSAEDGTMSVTTIVAEDIQFLGRDELTIPTKQW